MNMKLSLTWEKDDLRDKPLERQKMFDAFKETLNKYNKPYILVSGPKSYMFASNPLIACFFDTTFNDKF